MIVLQCKDSNINLEIRQIAHDCIKKLKVSTLDPRLDVSSPAYRGNYLLIWQLFKAKISKLFESAFKDNYRPEMPDWIHLEMWFNEVCSRQEFLDNLVDKK